MLNASRAVKKYFGVTVAAATGLTVGDGFIPNDPADEYIIMSGRTSTQDEGKDSFESTVSITLDIVTRNGNFGYKRSEEISELILAEINSDTAVTLEEPFTCSALWVENISNLDGLNQTDNVFRTLLTYNLLISQS